MKASTYLREHRTDRRDGGTQIQRYEEDQGSPRSSGRKVVRQRSVYLVHNASIPVFASMIPADRRYTVNHQARQAFRNNR